MSAFVCSPEHIGLLAAALARNNLCAEDASEMAERLMRDNISSVAYRYPDDIGNGDRPGYSIPDDGLIFAAGLYGAHFAENWPVWVTANDLWNMVHCFEYQSCEHPGWPDSISRRVIARLTRGGNCQLGPEHVRWEYTLPESEMLPKVLALFPVEDAA